MKVHKNRFRRPQQAEFASRPRPIFEDFHLLTMEGNYEYPRHQHTVYEIILIEKGPYRCELNGKEITLTQGQVLLINIGDWHQDHLHDGQRHYVLHFRLEGAIPGMPPPAIFSKSVSPDEQVCRDDFTREMWILSELREEAQTGAKYSGAVQDALLDAFFWRIIRGLDPNALSPDLRQLPEIERLREEYAAAFMRYINDSPNVTEIAKSLRVSPRYLVNRCKTLFGESPARLLLSFKLRRADELLRYRRMRVHEVSDELGFANPQHFSKVYNRIRGYPPSQSRSKPTI